MLPRASIQLSEQSLTPYPLRVVWPGRRSVRASPSTAQQSHPTIICPSLGFR